MIKNKSYSKRSHSKDQSKFRAARGYYMGSQQMPMLSQRQVTDKLKKILGETIQLPDLDKQMQIFDQEKQWTGEVKLQAAAKYSLMNDSIGKSLRAKNEEKRMRRERKGQSESEGPTDSVEPRENAMKQKDWSDMKVGKLMNVIEQDSQDDKVKKEGSDENAKKESDGGDDFIEEFASEQSAQGDGKTEMREEEMSGINRSSAQDRQSRQRYQQELSVSDDYDANSSVINQKNQQLAKDDDSIVQNFQSPGASAEKDTINPKVNDYSVAPSGHSRLHIISRLLNDCNVIVVPNSRERQVQKPEKGSKVQEETEQSDQVRPTHEILPSNDYEDAIPPNMSQKPSPHIESSLAEGTDVETQKKLLKNDDSSLNKGYSSQINGLISNSRKDGVHYLGSGHSETTNAQLSSYNSPLKQSGTNNAQPFLMGPLSNKGKGYNINSQSNRDLNQNSNALTYMLKNSPSQKIIQKKAFNFDKSLAKPKDYTNQSPQQEQEQKLNNVEEMIREADHGLTTTGDQEAVSEDSSDDIERENQKVPKEHRKTEQKLNNLSPYKPKQQQYSSSDLTWKQQQLGQTNNEISRPQVAQIPDYTYLMQNVKDKQYLVNGDSLPLETSENLPQLIHQNPSSVFLLNNTSLNSIIFSQRSKSTTKAHFIESSQQHLLRGDQFQTMQPEQDQETMHSQKKRFGERSKSLQNSKNGILRLQKPLYEEGNYSMKLKDHINDYNSQLKDHFKQKITQKKFKKIMKRETSANQFKTGIAKRILWDQHIEYKYQNNLYHHLDTIRQWELAKDPRSLESPQNQVYERKALNKGVYDLYQQINQNQKQLEIIKQKIKKGKRFHLKELTEDVAQLKFPQVAPKYLMNKYTCTSVKEDSMVIGMQLKEKLLNMHQNMQQKIVEERASQGSQMSHIKSEKRKSESVMVKPNPIMQKMKLMNVPMKSNKISPQLSLNSPLSPEQKTKALLKYDSSDYEVSSEEIEYVEEYQFNPKTEKILVENIRYECIELKQIVKKAIKYILTRKTKEQLREEQLRDKMKKIQANKKILDPYFGKMKMMRKLVDLDYLKRRYSNLSPYKKYKQKQKDSEKYSSFPLEEIQVLGFLKQKLSEQLSRILTDFIDDPENEINHCLSPYKTYQSDSFVDKIIDDLKAQLNIKTNLKLVKDEDEEADFSARDQMEYDRLRRDTIEFNFQLTNDKPEQLVVMPDAFKNKQFYEKFKAMISHNSLLEAHIESLPEDEDLLSVQYQNDQSNPSMDDTSPSGTKTREDGKKVKKGDKNRPDLDIIIAKICQDYKFYPVMSVMHYILSDTPGQLIEMEIYDFNLTEPWCKIILESLKYNQIQLRKSIQKIAFSNNGMTSNFFSQILEVITAQDGLKSIIYAKNELSEDCLDHLEYLVQEKNLESLTLKALKTDNGTITSLFERIQGSELQTLNLTQLKFFHFSELAEAFLDCIESLTDLKKLNVSNNDMPPIWIARLVTKISKNEKLKVQLQYLNLSHNTMRPLKQEVEKEKPHPLTGQPMIVIEKTDTKAVRLFYKYMKQLIAEGNLQHLNLEYMCLQKKVMSLASSICLSKSLLSIHLSNNQIPHETMALLKWQLSIGIDVESYREFDEELQQFELLPPKPEEALNEDLPQPDLKRSKTKIKVKKLENPYKITNIADLSSQEINQKQKEEILKEIQDEVKYTNSQKKQSFKEKKSLDMSIVNQIEKRAMAQKDQEWKLHHGGNDSVLHKCDTTLGEKVTLTRVLGHQEFEPVLQPMFKQKLVTRARNQLLEEERQAREISIYGGLLVNGKIIEPPRPPSKESEASESEEEYKGEDENLSNTRQFEEARAVIYGIKNLRYVQKNHMMKWQIQERCWRCEQARYAIVFYQRSKAHIWFNKVQDLRDINSVPKDLLEGYRNKIISLNKSFDVLKTHPDKRRKLVLDPVIVGNFEATKSRIMKNPHEYLDKLFRKEIMSEVQRSLVEPKKKIMKQYKRAEMQLHVYRKQFMVAWEEKWLALTRGVEWLKFIKNSLKYPRDSLFLNVPPFFNLDMEEEKQVYNSCVNQDLFVQSFFLMPGKQTLTIMDNFYNEKTGQIEEVFFQKEYIIDRMVTDLNKLSNNETIELTEYLNNGIVSQQKKIKKQLEKEAQEAKLLEKKLKMEEELRKQEEAREAEMDAKKAAFAAL